MVPKSPLRAPGAGPDFSFDEFRIVVGFIFNAFDMKKSKHLLRNRSVL